METKTSPLKRNTTLVINGHIYEVAYPNTGQTIDIELLKVKISDGNYDALRFSMNEMFQEQANKIDMIATFNTLIPKLKEDLTVRSLFLLTEEQSNELLKVYVEQFLPWFNPIKEAIRNPKATQRENEA